MRTSRRPTPPVPGGFGYPLGFLAAITVTLLAVATGATTHPHRALIPLAATTAAIAGLSTLRAALGTAAVCWAMHAGFVLGRRGDLALTPPAARDALVLSAVALVVSAGAVAVRATRAPDHPIILPAPRSPLLSPRAETAQPIDHR